MSEAQPELGEVTAPAHLNEKGQCPYCKIKPLPYRRPHPPTPGPFKFCCRCCRAYDFDSGWQVVNWAYALINGRFKRRCP
jgi:hypothetical protein